MLHRAAEYDEQRAIEDRGATRTRSRGGDDTLPGAVYRDRARDRVFAKSAAGRTREGTDKHCGSVGKRGVRERSSKKVWIGIFKTEINHSDSACYSSKIVLPRTNLSRRKPLFPFHRDDAPRF